MYKWTSGVQRNAMHSAKEPNEMTQGMLLKTECDEKWHQRLFAQSLKWSLQCGTPWPICGFTAAKSSCEWKLFLA